MLFFRKRSTNRKQGKQFNHASKRATLARLRPLRCEPLEDRRMLSITLFVDDDASSGGDGLAWATAYEDLQTALTQAEVLNADGDTNNNVDQIWVAEGTYLPSKELSSGNARSATFSLLDGVALYGGFAGTETTLEARDWNVHETILSGDIGEIGESADNALTVVTCPGVIETTIDGFSITAGHAEAWLTMAEVVESKITTALLLLPILLFPITIHTMVVQFTIVLALSMS